MWCTTECWDCYDTTCDHKKPELDRILAYMKQYVENKYEHDSEPMLNHKDIHLVLRYIDRLEKDLKVACEVIEKLKKEGRNNDDN